VADVKISELLDNVTLKMVLARKDFEERSEFLLKRVAKPYEDALKHAGLTSDDID